MSLGSEPVAEGFWDEFWAGSDSLIKIGALAALFLGTQWMERKTVAKKRTQRRRRR